MPHQTVSQRLRRRLAALLRPWGTAAALARYSQSRGGAALSTQEISFFMNGHQSRRPIKLDDLDDIAGFFHLTIGELLGETRVGDLTGDEQRLIYAFRALSKPTQAHFLALMEQASIAARVRLPLSDKP